MKKYFPKSFIALIRQGDELTFRQSSFIDVDAFIYTNDFKMHHFSLFFSNGGNRIMTVFKLSSISTKIKDFKKFEEYFRK